MNDRIMLTGPFQTRRGNEEQSPRLKIRLSNLALLGCQPRESERNVTPIPVFRNLPD